MFKLNLKGKLGHYEKRIEIQRDSDMLWWDVTFYFELYHIVHEFG